MTDAPTFCWHCHGDLKPGAAGLSYREVFDPDGRPHRVHHVCLDDAIGDGYTDVEPKQCTLCGGEGHSANRCPWRSQEGQWGASSAAPRETSTEGKP
jgi:hypothetical protein